MIDEVHMLIDARVQRDAEDARGAARVPQVRAGDDRSAEGAGDGAVALPAVQPAADGAARRCVEHLARVLATEDVAAEPRRCADRARRARLDARRAVADRPGDRLRQRRGSRKPACARCSARVDRSHAVALHRGAGRARRRGAVAAVDGLRELGLSAAGTLEEMAALLQEMAVLQAVPGARRRRRSRHAEVARAWPRCCRPTRRSCSTASCLHGRAELALAPDEYAALMMVLLRMLAFAPADARATPGAPPPTTARAAPAAAPRATASAPPRGVGAGVGRAAGAPAAARADRRRAADAGLADDVAGRRRRSRSADAATRRRSRPAASIDGQRAADRWTELGAAPGRRRRDRGDGARAGACRRECVAHRRRRRASRVWQLRVEREIAAHAGAARESAGGAGAAGRWARRCGIEIEAGAVDRHARRARDAAERDRRQAEAEQRDPRRPARAGADGAVQDGANRSGLGQTAPA